jgi:hypothetical protein
MDRDDEVFKSPEEDEDADDLPASLGSGPTIKKQSPRNILSFSDALVYAAPRPATTADADLKRTYGTRLSNALALLVADRLRPHFPEILPTQDGKGTESRARVARGYKKLDVNYSTLQTGLGLGVSIKTINFRDPRTERYTKNYSRNDNELRAEASDYHGRQPFAVMAAMLFLPWDAAQDAGKGKAAPGENDISSYGACVKYFRVRAGRDSMAAEPERFERFFVCLYCWDGTERGLVRCMDVMQPPPRARPPRNDETLSLDDAIAVIRDTYDRRNGEPDFEWAAD